MLAWQRESTKRISVFSLLISKQPSFTSFNAIPFFTNMTVVDESPCKGNQKHMGFICNLTLKCNLQKLIMISPDTPFSVNTTSGFMAMMSLQTF